MTTEAVLQFIHKHKRKREKHSRSLNRFICTLIVLSRAGLLIHPEPLQINSTLDEWELTVVRNQALARPQQQQHLSASCLDKLDGTRVCDALGWLAVDLYYLVSNLSAQTRH